MFMVAMTPEAAERFVGKLYFSIEAAKEHRRAQLAEPAGP